VLNLYRKVKVEKLNINKYKNNLRKNIIGIRASLGLATDSELRGFLCGIYPDSMPLNPKSSVQFERITRLGGLDLLQQSKNEILVVFERFLKYMTENHIPHDLAKDTPLFRSVLITLDSLKAKAKDLDKSRTYL
jgi:hypothetical protein